MSADKQKYFVTKYALTKGIIEVDGEVNRNGYLLANFFGIYSGFSKFDFYNNRFDAGMKAQNMRNRKVASLRKQIAKLEGLVFE